MTKKAKKSRSARKPGMPKRRIVTAGPGATQSLGQSIASFANGLTPAGSWRDLIAQSPTIIRDTASAMVDLVKPHNIFDVIELVRMHELPITLDDYRESESEGLAAVIDVVALVGLGVFGQGQILQQNGPTNPAASIEHLCHHAQILLKLATLLSF